MSITHRAFRAAAIFAAVVGIVAAIARTIIVAQLASTPAGRRPELSAYDARALSVLVRVSQLTPGSPEYVNSQRQVVRISNKYVEHARFTYAHMIAGILILVLAPFQFNRGLRNRHRRLHRWTGRAILTLVLVSAISAIFFGVFDAKAPPLERPTIALFGSLFLFAAARAFVAIRMRDIVRHREWMIRMLGMAIAIGTMRIVSIGVAFLVRASWNTQFVLSMWVGWLISVIAAELWIRHTRPVPIRAPAQTVVA